MTWDVAAAGWVRQVTDDGLEDAAGTGAFARGRGYDSSRMVAHAQALDGGAVVVAEVIGSGRRSYETVVELIDPDDEPEPMWVSQCSCPVGEDCKHVVAVLLGVRRAVGGEAATSQHPQWEQALARLVDPAGPTVPSQEYGSPVALIIERSVRPRDARAAASTRPLEIRPTRRTQAGRWAKKLSWRELQGSSYSSGVTIRPSHRHAVQELIALQRATTSRQGYHYGYGGHGEGGGAILLDDLGPTVWSTLRRIRDAGVELIGSVAGEPVPLHDDPAEVVFDLSREPEGLVLAPALESADSDPDPDAEPMSIALVGDPSHGVALLSDGGMALAPFATPLDSAVTALVREGGLRVPASEVDRFTGLYLPRLRERVTVVSSDGSVDLAEPSPPRLHLRVSGGPAGGLRIDLGFAYAGESGDLVVPAATGGGAPRDPKGEQALLSEVDELGTVPGARSTTFGTGGERWLLHSPLALGAKDAVRVLTDVVPRLEADPRVVVVVDDDVPVYEEIEADPEIAIGAAGGQGETDWLDLSVTVSIDGEDVPFEPLFQSLVRGDEIMVLDSGDWFRLDHPALTDLRALIEEARELAEPQSGQLRLSRYQVGLWEDLADLGDVDIERQHAWLSSVESLRALDTVPAPPVPTTLDATLRHYQVDGFHWLATLWDAGLGGVLADDMGLGKTVQTLALVARAAEAGDLDRPVLVIAPTSVVGTWASEAQRFVPSLDVRVLGQTHRRRGTTVSEAVDGAQLVITSYAVLRIDAEQFAEVPWRGVVVDEAQFVKNAHAKTHHAVRRLSAPFVLAVTGTPLENSLMDLWALLSLSAPGLYPRRETFTEVYRKPIESGAQPELLDRLRRRIRPLMLRRTKEQVALDLPPKQVQVLSVDLTPAHRRIYDRHLQRERKRVLGLLADPDANRVAILASLTRLRQLSLDPGLVDEEHLGQVSPAKVDLLVEHLHELAEEGHRALVFSQFTRFLGMVRERLTAEGVTTSYLDGKTTDRAQAIDDFRHGDTDAFLISLKAGGVGLTLTEADYVYVLDPWWNPAAESQAIDRAHRIGQDKPVMVYRLVSSGTIEEKVLALQERKRDLFERVVDDGGALSGKVTADDIRALLDPED